MDLWAIERLFCLYAYMPQIRAPTQNEIQSTVELLSHEWKEVEILSMVIKIQHNLTCIRTHTLIRIRCLCMYGSPSCFAYISE